MLVLLVLLFFNLVMSDTAYYFYKRHPLAKQPYQDVDPFKVAYQLEYRALLIKCVVVSLFLLNILIASYFYNYFSIGLLLIIVLSIINIIIYYLKTYQNLKLKYERADSN